MLTDQSVYYKSETMNPLLSFSATQLASMIRCREITASEVVEAHIEHIKAMNVNLRAMVKDRFKEAREEARRKDEVIRSSSSLDSLPPFYGVPFTVKECIGLTNMPQSAGIVARRHCLSTDDATAVARLRRAGAIPLGVTNISELCMWVESYNCVYGRTRNSYDLRRSSGGSSGGEGALIGAGGVPFGLASDIGGSIRIPAFFNGVFGHKPSGGLVPGTGQYPPGAPSECASDVGRYIQTGLLTRRAEDLMPLLKLIAGPDQIDKSCLPWKLENPELVDLAQLRVLCIFTNGVRTVNPDLLNAQSRCRNYLSAVGACVQDANYPMLKQSFHIWASMLAFANRGEWSYKKLLGNGSSVRPHLELLKWIVRRSAHTLPALLLVLFEDLLQWRTKRIHKFVEMGEALRLEILEDMGPQGVILFPSYPGFAPYHGTAIFHPFDFSYTAIFNVLGFAVTQVPLGLNRDGLPLGIQVAAAPGNDHLTIAVAMALEKIFGGWTASALARSARTASNYIYQKEDLYGQDCYLRS